MTPAFLRGVPAFVPLLLLLLLAACAGKKESAPEKRAPAAKVFDVREDGKRPAPDGEAEKCHHVYQQSGIHPYTAMREGLPSTELCVVSRCVKCGAVLHECQAKGRRRR